MHNGERTYLIVIQPGERGDPIVPHGVDCDGYLIVEEHGKMADLKCNSCGAVVDTVPLKRAGERLMQLALVEISSACVRIAEQPTRLLAITPSKRSSAVYAAKG
jgi:hypothetical protein